MEKLENSRHEHPKHRINTADSKCLFDISMLCEGYVRLVDVNIKLYWWRANAFRQIAFRFLIWLIFSITIILLVYEGDKTLHKYSTDRVTAVNDRQTDNYKEKRNASTSSIDGFCKNKNKIRILYCWLKLVKNNTLEDFYSSMDDGNSIIYGLEHQVTI